MGTLFSRVLLGIRSIRSRPANYRRAARGNLVARFGGDESVILARSTALELEWT